MKKHDFNSAIEIFKQMFEGWSVVTKDGEKFEIQCFDLEHNRIAVEGRFVNNYTTSRLEQTLPLNGDEVWYWYGDRKDQRKAIYLAPRKNGHVVVIGGNYEYVNNVELISPIRQLTIQEATEIIHKGEKVEEPFEIIKE